ncbi:SpaH/EbpB family LPXTG-anchored major pilin [Microbacterium sp. PRF11]|uniref:SpaH/EbpB family LPXTG-anchored major pilin n=1 Tax=Microbacterium sp. PRF11 TaxID=2962593 RepID=UPI00288119E1|nr:SpaH/EbpB family LPXTG-anchored major pilin [Microbacterium sp. PRF11]MDT0115806.1 SpaH/EbpB family LPXTG-anchored major pilin [Microbacterium sp. PRF11]
MSIRKRAGAVLSVLAIGALAAVGAAAPASAVTLPGNIDSTVNRTLTIHKHALGPSTPLNPFSTGQQLANPPADPLAGAQFTATLVTGIDLTTSAGWSQAASLTPAQAAQRPNTVSFVSTVSNTAGVSTFPVDAAQYPTGMPIGVYLVTETQLPPTATNPAAPFLVTLPTPTGAAGSPSNQWIYDVHVYPKNAVTQLTKTRVPAPAGSIEQRNPDLVRWAIASSIPTLAAGDALDVFTLTDNLPAELTYLDATTTPAGVTPSNVVVTNAAGTAQTFTAGTDYTIANTGGALTLNFTSQGLNRLTALQGGTVTFNVLTRATAIPASGVIVNTATANVNGATETVTGSTPIGQLTVSAYTTSNGIRVPLAGAVYQVFLNEQDANNGANPIVINGETNWTTGANGNVVIPIITPGNYYVREITPPSGYQLPNPPQALTTVTPGPTSTANPVRNYVEFAHNQVPAFALPITGGDGGLWFGIGGAALLTAMVGSALVVARRRARGAQAAV